MAKAENDTQNAIVDYLNAIGWLAWRQNNHATPGRRFIGMRGVSDVVALQPGGPSWWIEVKNPSVGKKQVKGQLSQNQKEFRDRIQKMGHIYVKAYSLDDVISAIEEQKARAA